MRQLTLISLLLSAFFTVANAQSTVNNNVENNDTIISVDNILQNFLCQDSIATDSTSVLPDSLMFILDINNIIDDGQSDYTNGILFMPLVFEKYEFTPYERLTTTKATYTPQVCNISKETNIQASYNWLVRANRQDDRLRAARNYLIVNRPDLVKYNYLNLPKAPKEYVLVNDPTKQTITIVEKPKQIVSSALESKPVKIKRWRMSFSSNIQLSQVYVSATSTC